MRILAGAEDLYVSQRHNKLIDTGWQIPLNLGDGINTSTAETGPALFEDDQTGIITLYFTAQRQLPPWGWGRYIYASTLQEDETFGNAEFVEGLNDLGMLSWRPAIRKDGLEFFVDSILGTPAGANGGDIWVYMRASTAEPWSGPINLGSTVNALIGSDLRPALSFDGTELHFHSNRAGGLGSNKDECKEGQSPVSQDS